MTASSALSVPSWLKAPTLVLMGLFIMLSAPWNGPGAQYWFALGLGFVAVWFGLFWCAAQIYNAAIRVLQRRAAA